MEVHCIDSFKNLTEINEKTSYYLVAPGYDLYFNNFRNIIFKTIFFLSVFFFFFKSSKFSFHSDMQKSSCLPKPTFHVQHLKPYAHICTVNTCFVGFYIFLNYTFKFDKYYMWLHLQIVMKRYKIFAWQVTYVYLLSLF